MVLHYNLGSKSLITEKETPLENLQCELALEQTERKNFLKERNTQTNWTFICIDFLRFLRITEDEPGEKYFCMRVGTNGIK